MVQPCESLGSDFSSKVSDEMKLIDVRRKSDETTVKQLGQAYCYSLVAPSSPFLGTSWQTKSFLTVAILNSNISTVLRNTWLKNYVSLK